MGIRSELRRLLGELDDTDNAAFDLWSWLPSAHFAKQAHGDYADECGQSTPSDTINEACAVLSYAAGYDLRDDMSIFACACDACTDPTREQVLDYLARFRQPVESKD